MKQTVKKFAGFVLGLAPDLAPFHPDNIGDKNLPFPIAVAVSVFAIIFLAIIIVGGAVLFIEWLSQA